MDADHRLLIARAAMLQEGRGMTLASTLVTTTAVGLVMWLWFALDPWVVGLWYLSNYVILGAFVAVMAAGRYPDDVSELSADALHKWDYVGVGFSFLSGVPWGVAAWLFIDPGELDRLLFLVAVFLGNGMAAMPMLCPKYPAFVAFVTPAFAPFALRLVFEDDTSIQVIGVLMGVYLTLLLYFGRMLASFITRTLTTDIENERLLAEVTQANLDKSRFLASVSHDLRQPLAAMGLFLGAVRREALDDANRDAIDNIQGSFSALDDMCTSLLEISRLDSGAVEAQPCDCRIGPLLDRLAVEFAGIAEQRGLDFACRHDNPVVITDPVLMERILGNLLSNAIKYTDEGGVRLEATRTGDSICIAVADSGCGIGEADREAIFDEYRQLGNPARDRREGLGLGLSVVRQLCALLGHEVTLDSAPGAGSTFTVRCPAGDAASVSAPPASELRTVSIRGLHIAVLDDDESIVRGMCALLEGEGALVTAATSLAGLLDLLDSVERPPDLLVCDYRLGDTSGIDAVAAIRSAIDPELPAILMTGDTQRELRAAAADAGLYLLHKPVKVAHLINVVGELV